MHYNMQGYNEHCNQKLQINILYMLKISVDYENHN